MNKLSRKIHQGYTLVEVIIAIVILGLIMSGVFGAVSTTVKANRAIKAVKEMENDINSALNAMKMDIKKGINVQVVQPDQAFQVDFSDGSNNYSRIYELTDSAIKINGAKIHSDSTVVKSLLVDTDIKNHSVNLEIKWATRDKSLGGKQVEFVTKTTITLEGK